MAGTLLAAAAPGGFAARDFDARAFAAAQAEDRVIVIETYADWCLACRLQAPILARLTGQGRFHEVTVFRVTDHAPRPAWRRFHLAEFGTLVVFRGSRPIARGMATTQPAIEALLIKAL